MAHAATSVESRSQRSNLTSSLCHFIIFAPCSHSALLHDHGELHVLVDRAIQVVDAWCIPRSNLMTGIPRELQTADLRRARFLFGFGRAMHPLTKANEMDIRHVIDQLEAVPFLMVTLLWRKD